MLCTATLATLVAAALVALAEVNALVLLRSFMVQLAREAMVMPMTTRKIMARIRMLPRSSPQAPDWLRRAFWRFHAAFTDLFILLLCTVEMVIMYS
jgi:hypothetical protein